MAKAHPGLFKPKSLPRAGRNLLAELCASNPDFEPSELRKWFIEQNPHLLIESKLWWLDYECAGCMNHPEGGRHRESSGKIKVRDAQAELDKRRGVAAEGKQHTNESEIRMTELFKNVLNDAKVHLKQSTFKEYEDKVRVHLEPELGAFRAVALCHDPGILVSFIAKKKGKGAKNDEEGYSGSSINGMLQIVKRAFSLAKNRISIQPVIPTLKIGDNSRRVFFTDAETTTLLKNLPEEIARPIEVLYLTGWRWSEVYSRRRYHVDWKKKELILEAGEAKNSEPRTFPLEGMLLEILKDQDEVTRRLEREKGMLINALFHDAEGKEFAVYYESRGSWKPTRAFNDAWNAACKSAGLIGRIRHDFRRTAVRRYDAIADHIGMELSGHKSHVIYRKYKATSEEDKRAAVKQLFKEMQSAKDQAK